MSTLTTFYLSAYDPAHQSPSGDYWVWHHDAIPHQLLDTFYYDYAQSSLPNSPNLITPEDLYGGCVLLNTDWVCWYRFINGGRDNLGRPGRCIILCAFGRRSEQIGHDSVDVFDTPAFRVLTDKIPVCPLPTQDRLIVEIPTKSPCAPPSTQLVDDLSFRFYALRQQAKAFSELGAVVAQFAGRQGVLHAKLKRVSGVESVDYKWKIPTLAIEARQSVSAVKPLRQEPTDLATSFTSSNRHTTFWQRPFACAICFFAGIILGFALHGHFIWNGRMNNPKSKPEIRNKAEDKAQSQTNRPGTPDPASTNASNKALASPKKQLGGAP